VNFLSEAEKLEVLDGRGKRWARARSLWRGRTSRGKTERLFRFTGSRWTRLWRRADTDFVSDEAAAWENFSREGVSVSRGESRYSHVLHLSWGEMFAPNGEIFDEETVRRLMEIPEIKGMKHSSLDRLTELRRLELRDACGRNFGFIRATILAST